MPLFRNCRNEMSEKDEKHKYKKKNKLFILCIKTS